jgi:hypothetical protein
MEKDEAFRKLLDTSQNAYMFISQLLINDLSEKEVKDIQELLANLAEGIFVAGDFLNQEATPCK